jgi:peptidyl-prolyl cis-trans isomerase B (cyclophilin B)
MYLLATLILVAIIAVAVVVYAYIQPGGTNAGSQAVVYAKLNTPQGLIEIELYQNATPKTVTNFVSLANSGFYNNLVWHRIVRQFVIQTGDPNSRNGANSTWGQGGSSQTIPLESVPTLHNYAGYVAMAHLPNDVNSGTSQFYINLNDTNARSLDGSYTVFGKVTTGMNVALSIANVPVYSGSNQPITPVYLTSVTISNNP